MPIRPGRPCRYPGCPAVVSDRGGFCDDHKQDDPKNRDRPSASKRGYGVRWRRLRRMQLNCQPLCADPFGLHYAIGEVMAATEVDHILPRGEGGEDRMDNLQSLCKRCHSRKTAGELGWMAEDKHGRAG